MTTAGNIIEVRRRIEEACRRSGRAAGEVTLIAVSKTVSPGGVAEAAVAGVTDFGENRIQEARSKIPLCPPGNVWHLIGTLQRNKVKDAVRLFRWIHSVDSMELARAMDERVPPGHPPLNVLVEVKLSPEETKHGVPPEEAQELVRRMVPLERLAVRGLMTIAPYDPDPEAARPVFRSLRLLGREIKDSLSLPGFDQLSMGMTQDFEVAVEEGATLVRVGTAIFGARLTLELK